MILSLQTEETHEKVLVFASFQYRNGRHDFENKRFYYLWWVFR